MKKEVRLWLDDVRPAPEGWLHVRTIAEAQEVLQRGNVVEASLDNDLGEAVCQSYAHGVDVSECQCGHFLPEGRKLVDWMAANGIWPPRLKFHTSNPVARQHMVAIASRYGDYDSKLGDVFVRVEKEEAESSVKKLPLAAYIFLAIGISLMTTSLLVYRDGHPFAGSGLFVAAIWYIARCIDSDRR